MNESEGNPENTAGTLPESRAPESIEVWVCDGCGSYYAASGAGDLGSQLNRRTSMRNAATEDPSEWGKITGPRSICQPCKQRTGEDVERRRATFVSTDHLPAALERASQAAEAKAAERAAV